MSEGEGTGRAGGRGRGRPPVITREQIVRAARDVGLDRLRMSSVAEALNVRPAALYHHVRSRDELVELVAWQVLEETNYDDWTPDNGTGWRGWIRAYAHALRRAMLDNAALFQYIRLTTAATTHRLDHIERLVGVLVDAGFGYTTASHTIQHVHLMIEAEVRDAVEPEGSQQRQFTEFHRALAARPGDDLPHLRRMAEHRPGPDPDAQFEFMLDCLLEGLATRLDRP
ncbi:TetR/AcrR family transcriptional regulator [Haloechinothrix sp. LS1_15]|uniref:TetR/AcrR family transcriptional regulator n=1 Tax=Haloechinothrix sp. LS1_15 TaxID=2652248 RepID=UPI0029451596|nr:TetR/AcrR family transcriptional regulator [Haloechinothrix sp. LS1_15]MDV6014143.1 TetR/AcrR family transcriptional regulator [Haloechinothrix sp. LS1_15]